MSITDDQLRAIRDEIGDSIPPTDDDLADSFDERGGIWQAVAIGVLKRRYATYMTSGTSSSITIPGVIAVAGARQEGILAPQLLEQIRRLQAQIIGGGGRIRNPYRRAGWSGWDRNIHVELFRL